jgi:hypothetical protein
MIRMSYDSITIRLINRTRKISRNFTVSTPIRDAKPEKEIDKLEWELKEFVESKGYTVASTYFADSRKIERTPRSSVKKK